MYPGGHAADFGSTSKSKINALPFKSKAPRLHQRNLLREHGARPSTVGYSPASQAHRTMMKQMNMTSQRYSNMKSPLSRFGAKTRSQRDWEDRLNNLDYATGAKPGDGASAIGGGAQYGKFKTVAANIEASASSCPLMRSSRKGYRIRNGAGEQLTGDGRPKHTPGSFSTETLRALKVPEPSVRKKRQPVRYPARIP
jgi:hypothetical protein